MSKWAWLREKFPMLPSDPSYGDGLQAQIDQYRELPIQQVAEEYNDLDEELAEREQETKALKLKLQAAERVLEQKMADAGLESAVIAGFKWTPKIDVYPNVKDKTALREWAFDHMRDNLNLHAGTVKTLVKDALEAGDKLPPGVEVFLKGSFSRTKQ